jgi:hypothetical protein
VKTFGAAGQLGLINWANSFCGLFATSLNSFLSSRNVPYDVRFSISAGCAAVGLLGLALSPVFWLACASIIFVGFSCNFGESVTFGYMAHIRKQPLVKAWGVGTGVAGILGAGYSTLCAAFDFPYKISFYVLLPLVVIYLVSYFCVLRERQVVASNPLLDKPEAVECLNWSLLGRIVYYMATIDLVYFAAYAIGGAFLDCAEQQGARHDFLFPLLSMTQHIGVLIFCSSLQWFEFPWLWTLAACQFISFALWLSHAMLHWMPLAAMFPFIFPVGVVSGLAYVNTYHCVLTDGRLSEKEKELGTNWTTLSVTAAVLVAALFTYASEQTYLQPFVPK